MIIVNKHLVPKGFNGITIWPFIFLAKYDADVHKHLRTVIHEKIHLKQQLECLIIPFYIIYAINYLFTGYRGIAFEREAYDNEDNKLYLKERKNFAWIKYWFRNNKQTLVIN